MTLAVVEENERPEDDGEEVEEVWEALLLCC